MEMRKSRRIEKERFKKSDGHRLGMIRSCLGTSERASIKMILGFLLELIVIFAKEMNLVVDMLHLRCP